MEYATEWHILLISLCSIERLSLYDAFFMSAACIWQKFFVALLALLLLAQWIQELLSHGDEMEVLAPQWLRDNLIVTLDNMKRIYEG